MKIFLTGATGFVGAHFLGEALARGHTVMALRRQRSRMPRLQHAMVKWVEGDLQNLPWEQIEGWGPEVVVHAAWIATPGVYLDSPLNHQFLESSCAMLDRAARMGVRQALVLGTCAEYASSKHPIPESGELAPGSPYALAKDQLRRWLEKSESGRGLSWSWCRLFYPYGVGEHPERLPSYVIRRLRAGEPVQLQQPDAIRDYIHIRDVTAGLLMAMEKKVEGVLNIGSGTGVRVGEIAEGIAREMGRLDLVPTFAEGRKTVEASSLVVADVTRLMSLGWRPEVSMETGLRELVGLSKGGDFDLAALGI